MGKTIANSLNKISEYIEHNWVKDTERSLKLCICLIAAYNILSYGILGVFSIPLYLLLAPILTILFQRLMQLLSVTAKKISEYIMFERASYQYQDRHTEWYDDYYEREEHQEEYYNYYEHTGSKDESYSHYQEEKEESELKKALKVFGFSDINEVTVLELKKRYHDLAKMYHTDNGGTQEDMQALNVSRAYLKRFLNI